MESIQNDKGSRSHRNPPADSERGPSRDATTIRGSADRDLEHSTFPKAFESMLRTTTETGDIGVFSSNPSSVSQRFNGRQRTGGGYKSIESYKPSQLQPDGVPVRDDRRLLPSYAKDVASGVISMYESPSQKSASRVFDDDPYPRSHSMTQAFSSYPVSDQRPYGSLRSQPDGNAYSQRPRSPFAYPTRLRRPGFRPSSPALADGGGIDYSRRAEIERVPYGPHHSTLPPSSSYAQGRRPPSISLGPNTDRSRPPLLGQSPPPRQSPPSPHMGQGGRSTMNDWQRKNGSFNMTTSPAASTSSLTSAFQTAPAGSSTTTPERNYPRSPLYYDYTEDFDVDEYSKPEIPEPPSQFQVEKTIPEYWALGVDYPSTGDFNGGGAKRQFDRALETPPSRSVLPSSVKDFQYPSTPRPDRTTFRPDQEVQSLATTNLKENTPDKIVDIPRDKKVIRLSGLGRGARELSSHVEEAFGLPPSQSFELLVRNESASRDGSEEDISTSTFNGSTFVPEDSYIETQSRRTSTYSLNTNLLRFPQPPNVLSPAGTGYVVNLGDGGALRPGRFDSAVGSNDLRSQKIFQKDISTMNGGIKTSGSRHEIRNATILNTAHLSSPGTDQMRPSHPCSTDAGLTCPRDAAPTLACSTYAVSRNSSSTSPVFREKSLIREESSQRLISSPSTLFNQVGSDNSHYATSDPKHGNLRSRAERPDLASSPGRDEEIIKKSSRQIPRKLMSRSESPMLSPDPILPASQLRLKNSAPQLMKALPPLPYDQPNLGTSTPIQTGSFIAELPCPSSLLELEDRQTPNQEPEGAVQPHEHPEPREDISIQSTPVELDSAPVEAAIVEDKEGKASETPSPQKFKLKSRSSTAPRPTSPQYSCPSNLERSCSRSNQDMDADLPANMQDEIRIKPNPPRFKLKITRASNSTLGTVRVNKESAGSKAFSGLHFRHPKDLFTPSSGIDIFRQVGKHLHSRNASTSSSPSSVEGRQAPILTPISDQLLTKNQPPNLESNTLQPSTTSTNRRSPSDVRSFFSDGSSHNHGKLSLRKRLSKLRARVAVPYATRKGAFFYDGAHSSDDIDRRDRNGAQDPTLSGAGSVNSIQAVETNTEGRHMRRLTHRMHKHKLRERVSGWVREARSKIVARMRPRDVGREGDDHVHLIAEV